MKRLFTQLRLHFRGNIIPLLMNVAGMTIAFVAAIVIFIQVYYDATYDLFHANADRLFKLEMVYPTEKPDSLGRTITLAVPFVEALMKRNETSEIKNVSYSYLSPEYRTWHGDTCDFALPKLMVDSSFVEMFSFEIVSGSMADFYAKKNVALIPESVALEQWGRTDIVGEVIDQSKSEVTVAAVYKDFPGNTLLKNYVYVPITQKMIDWDASNWGNWCYYVFVELADAQDYEPCTEKLSERLEQVKKDYSSVSPLAMRRWNVDLISIHELHYISQFSESNIATVSKNSVILLFVISLVIILIAGFNYANYSIALIPRRIKKVNMYRLLGAGRGRLILGMLGESVAFVLVAWMLAVLVIVLYADEWMFSTSTVRIDFSMALPVYIYTFLGAVVIGVLLGLFPALYLTRESPQMALKHHFGLSRSGRMMQDVLLTVQFFCSITLISSSYTMIQQERFLWDGGIQDNDWLLFAYMKDTIPDSAPLYEQLRAVEGVENVALSRSILTAQDEYTSWGWKGVIVTILPVSKDYFDVMGIDIVEGRSFTERDSFAIVFNETACKQYAGKIKAGGRYAEGDGFPGFDIVGICKDVNYKSLRAGIEPMGFVLEDDDRLTCANVRVSADCDIDRVKKQLAEALDKVDLNYSHSFRSLDEIYVTTYRYERLTTNRISLFAMVAIIISFMGLCCIVIMNSEYRMKETAVKKVLGASVGQVLREQLLRYVAMALIAVCASVPVYDYFMNSLWLDKFCYHVDFSWWMFVVPALLSVMVIIAVATLFMYRYMRKNPAPILKYE